MERAREFLYPRAGYRRTIEYIGHRVRRIPDTPHRIALGFACGAFVSFTPLFGLHFFVAMGLAWALRGNVLASLIGTFVGNPLTFPLIASVSMALGRRILGYGGSGRDPHRIGKAFSEAGEGLWHGAKSLFGHGEPDWPKLSAFFTDVLWPYLVGGLLPGLVTAVACYWLLRPLVAAYQTAEATIVASRSSPPARGLPMAPQSPPGRLRLGVNIDHVATVRNARGSPYPDPLRAALMAEAAGADGITAHLREDRRHITDRDIDALSAGLGVPLNLEMAATLEMQAIALRHRPHAVCLVPERREERTTEGGLEVVRDEARLRDFIAPLREAGCRVSIFIAPDPAQIEAAARIGTPVIELHTGAYCEHDLARDDLARDAELARLVEAAGIAQALGLEVHAGHGLTTSNVAPIARLTGVRELNIGHSLIGEAIFVGLEAAIRDMRAAMDAAARP
jgi:pyridoxine 5-phosphate synthase